MLIYGSPSSDIRKQIIAVRFVPSSSWRMTRSAGASVPVLGTARDWPAMRWRGVDDDLSRGPVPTRAFQKHQLDLLTSYEINIHSPYLESTMEYKGNP